MAQEARNAAVDGHDGKLREAQAILRRLRARNLYKCVVGRGPRWAKRVSANLKPSIKCFDLVSHLPFPLPSQVRQRGEETQSRPVCSGRCVTCIRPPLWLSLSVISTGWDDSLHPVASETGQTGAGTVATGPGVAAGGSPCARCALRAQVSIPHAETHTFKPPTPYQLCNYYGGDVRVSADLCCSLHHFPVTPHGPASAYPGSTLCCCLLFAIA